MRAVFDAFVVDGDITPLVDALADDAVLTLTVGPGTPLSGEFKGKAGIENYFAVNADTVSITDFVVTNYLTGGRQVAVIGHETLTVIKSGESQRNSTWIVLATFGDDDKIDRIAVVQDSTPIWAAYAQ